MKDLIAIDSFKGSLSSMEPAAHRDSGGRSFPRVDHPDIYVFCTIGGFPVV